jgi:hypothetical protein
VWNGLNQKWSLKYMDELPKAPKKGDWCGEYGLHHLRDFHLVSALPLHRYLDYVSTESIIKVANGRPTQTWYFDWVTRTIRSRASTAKHINIEKSGKKLRIMVGGVHSLEESIFKFANGRVQNILTKKVLTVKDGKDQEAN